MDLDLLVIDVAVVRATRDRAVDAIRTARDALDLDAFYTWVDDIVSRSDQLVAHLEAIETLASAQLFAPSLSATRTALEAHVLNTLVRHSRKYNKTFDVPPEVTDAELDASVSRLRSEFGELAKVQPNKLQGGDRTVTIAWQDRPEVEVLDDSHRSPYYQFGHWFNGIVHKSIRRKVNPNERPDSEDDRIWRKHLTWKELLNALKRDDLASPAEIEHLHSHYAFLSRFTHPTTEGSPPGRATTETVCALYGCAIAGSELASLAAYIDTLPHHRSAVIKLRRIADTAAKPPQSCGCSVSHQRSRTSRGRGPSSTTTGTRRSATTKPGSGSTKSSASTHSPRSSTTTFPGRPGEDLPDSLVKTASALRGEPHQFKPLDTIHRPRCVL